MNLYRFYHKGKHYVSIWGNDVTENHISACADLAKRGLTPDYWHDPETGKDVLSYTDSFKLERINNHGELITITPENIGILAKSLQKKLSAFTYDGEEWRVKTK